MAAITARYPGLAGVSRAARASWSFLREAPSIPVVILGILVFVAVFAPLIAPHDKLQPVTQSPEACLKAYGFEDCPWIADIPPVWSTITTGASEYRRPASCS